jgi:hypothetical protein
MMENQKDNNQQTPQEQPAKLMPANFETHIKPHQFLPGVSGNPAGRKRKFVTEMKDSGYKLTEINDTIQALLACTMEELKEVYESPRATILERSVAGALRRSFETRSLHSIETLLTRSFGAPKETIDNQLTQPQGPIEIVIRPALGAPPIADSEAEVSDV